MKVYGKVLLFVVCVVALFAIYGGSIPQVTSQEAEPIEIGDSPEELVEAGRRLFARENSCLTCHSLGPDAQARCPDQIEASRVAGTRRPELTAVEYLVESVYDPNAYVVEGYPKDQMRPVNRPPLSLGAEEVRAVLCYILSLAGTVDAATVRAIEVAQEPYQSGRIQVAPTASEIALEMPEDPEDLAYMLEDGQQAFADMKCWQCHTVRGVEWSEWTDLEIEIDEANIGPDLSNIGGIQGAQYLLESMLSPSAVIVAPVDLHSDEQGRSKMPDYSDSMTVRQLLDITAWMASLTGEGAP